MSSSSLTVRPPSRQGWAPQARPHGSTLGFTLIELLVVIAIIGILSAVLFSNLSRGVRQQKLREAGTQLMSDLNRARTQSARASVDASVTLTSTSATSPKPTYTTVWTVNGSAQTNVMTLPNSIQVAPVATFARAVTYSAPNIESSAPGGLVWRLTNTAGDELFIKMLGTTGKVVLSAAQ